MKSRKIDPSSFPVRKVVSSRPARSGMADLEAIITLDCGHEVGLKLGYEEPVVVACYYCDKALKNAQGT